MEFRRRRAAIALVAASLLAFPAVGAGGAGNKPSVIVAPMAGVGVERAREAVIASLRKSSKVVVVESEAVDRYLDDRRAAGRAEGSGTQEASDFLAAGQELYRQLKIKEAVEYFVKAKLSFRSRLSEAGAFEGLRAAQFHLAMSYLAAGDRGRARAELKDVILLDPERYTRALSPRLYSPKIRQLYEEVRGESRRQPTGDLDIFSAPAGALAYVDGRSAGATPARVKGLPVGEHFVSVQMRGQVPVFSSKFIVEGPNQFEAELKAAKAVDPAAYFGTVLRSSDIDHERAAFLDEMGLALGGEIFVFLSPALGAVKGQLYDQRSQEVSPVESGGAPDGLVAKLVRHIDGAGYVSPAKETAPGPAAAPAPALAETGPQLPPELEPKESGTLSGQAESPLAKPNVAKKSFWVENKWIWIGVGAALVAAGGSVLLFTDVAKSGPSKSTLTTTLP